MYALQYKLLKYYACCKAIIKKKKGGENLQSVGYIDDMKFTHIMIK